MPSGYLEAPLVKDRICQSLSTGPFRGLTRTSRSGSRWNLTTHENEHAPGVNQGRVLLPTIGGGGGRTATAYPPQPPPVKSLGFFAFAPLTDRVGIELPWNGRQPEELF